MVLIKPLAPKSISRLALLHGGFLLPDEIGFLVDVIQEASCGDDCLVTHAIRRLGASLRLIRVLGAEAQQ